MSIDSDVSLDQANCIIHTLASLQYGPNKYYKLCYSKEEICLDWSNSAVRTISNTFSYLSSFVVPTGWSRDLESLQPLIDKVSACMLKTLTDPTEVIITIGKLKEAQAGLRALAKNQYPDQKDKVQMIEKAISTLERTVSSLAIPLQNELGQVSTLFVSLIDENSKKDRRIEALEQQVAEFNAYFDELEQVKKKAVNFSHIQICLVKPK